MDKPGYTVSKEYAFAWLDKFQTKRPDGRPRFIDQERKSLGGWGVWDLLYSHWVWVDLELGR